MDWSKIKNQISGLVKQPGLAVSFTIGGVSYTGTKTTLRRQDVNTDGGLAGSYTFSLICARDDFSTLPVPRRSIVVLDGVSYRVLSVERDALDASIRLNLGDITQ